MRARFPQFNWIVVHVKHTTKFDGTKGVDWGHKHHELDIQIGGTIGYGLTVECGWLSANNSPVARYEIYNFKSGEFTRHGDGGFINVSSLPLSRSRGILTLQFQWAFQGNLRSRSSDGRHLVFNAP